MIYAVIATLSGRRIIICKSGESPTPNTSGMSDVYAHRYRASALYSTNKPMKAPRIARLAYPVQSQSFSHKRLRFTSARNAYAPSV